MERPSWFKFDPLKWLTGRIQRATPDVQIAFIRLCCIYWSNECQLTAKRARLEAGKDALDYLLELEIVDESEENIRIKFMDELYEEATQKSRKRKMAADKRWYEEKASAEKQDAIAMQTDANAMQMHSKSNANAMQRRVEERREEERREELTTSIKEVAAVEVSLNKKHALQLLADTSFLSVAAMNNLIAMKLVQDYIVSFHEHLAQDGKTHEKFTEFRKHFNNWLRVQLSAKAEPAHRYIKEKAQ